ncbi:hypothetical protein [Shewanella morhuae]|uniref:hypothetical protein n=1 Tax=Shewanella morhuae TaxID=365591 RepID=UPI001BC24C2A|nr:hypothetical protein [Shewanella morhuae]GIU03227.1 hypothetical protein TUM4641_08080 [Shewanella morhuae]
MKELEKYFDLVKYDYDPEWQIIDVTGDLKPRDYFIFAIKDLEGDLDSRSLINALLNAKRALHYQVDLLVDTYGYKSHTNRNSFPAKLEYCKKCGIVSPRVLNKLNKIRNEVEHDYAVPTETEVNDFIDVVELFLAATDRFFYRLPDNIVFPGLDEQNSDKFSDIYNVKLIKNLGQVILARQVNDNEQYETIKAPDERFFIWISFLNRCTQ